jgi:hypothetical protein
MKRKWLEWQAWRGCDVPSAKIATATGTLTVPLHLLEGVDLGELVRGVMAA